MFDKKYFFVVVLCTSASQIFSMDAEKRFSLVAHYVHRTNQRFTRKQYDLYFLGTEARMCQKILEVPHKGDVAKNRITRLLNTLYLADLAAMRGKEVDITTHDRSLASGEIHRRGILTAVNREHLLDGPTVVLSHPGFSSSLNWFDIVEWQPVTTDFVDAR